MVFHKGHADSLALYGSTAPNHKDKYSRLNFVAVLLNICVPTLIFGTVFGVLSFWVHYAHPGICWFFVVMALLVGLSTIAFAVHTVWRRKNGEMAFDEPSWVMFLCVSCLMAWCLGLMLGQWNYHSSMLQYYQRSTLNTYADVDPAAQTGMAMMDGGMFTFSADSYILTQYAVGFKKDHVYCAAPISSVPVNQPGPLAVYDFWAVGVDCCSGEPGDFACGFVSGKESTGHNIVRLTGGPRAVDDAEIPWFALAAQQAEAYYNIKMSHPIFVRNDVDPLAYDTTLRDKGTKRFCFYLFLYFGFQLLIVGGALILFCKAYHHNLDFS
jgi:hypothetical protein